jgi:Holliday junction resolvasome RuvABC DNA-binding subunit
MYDFIEGNIESLNPTHVVISNQGLGYIAAISLTTYEKIKGHKNARLFVDLLFKVENQSPVSMNLYAFLILMSATCSVCSPAFLALATILQCSC